MTVSESNDPTAESNEESLRILARAIALSEGQFSLILARCNYSSLRDRLVQRLRQLCPIEIQELVLSTTTKTLYTIIKSELGNQQPPALMVFGLETVSDLEIILTSTNQVREEFRKEFTFPLVLWINDEIQQKLIKLAPDLESWSTTVGFAIAPESLLDFLTQTIDEVFAKVLEVGAEAFLYGDDLHLGKGSSRQIELECAQQELEGRGDRLDPSMEAGLEFVLGRATTDSAEKSRAHYERSLTLWQDHNKPERRGCVLFSLGLWWRTYAVQHRNLYDQACSQAADYYQQAIATFEQANRPDLVAHFINPLGEVLQRLQRWDELAEIAKKSLLLNQTYPNLFRQARAHGFLAEVALAKAAWSKAQQSAETALQLLETASQALANPSAPDQQTYLSWERVFNRGWYLFALGRSQRQLQQPAAAIHTLETAQTEIRADYDPSLYIRILAELRSLYFEQKEYLKAFDVKLAQQSIEQQYGFRAFIGAGRLQPQKAVLNPALINLNPSGAIAQEIAASGRQQDVNRLIGRLSRADQKLIVLHGQSGVGKSSIVQAGLIPALNPITLDTRDVVVVLQQVYTNWTERLSQRLIESLQGIRKTNLLQSDSSTPVILQQLRQSVNQNLMLVLIFDQFEEFFFVYKDPVERRPFYEFLRDCLNIPYVKVVLSLREDYLHYLLECNERLINLDIINNNILDKNILFYLGNFSREDAQSVISILTQHSQLALEPDLVEALVSDLAEEVGEVRPIELQVVGTQLQTEQITTLQRYQERGPKDALVERFLEEVIHDCGAENEDIARLVLYLLTDENNTRPLKTRADLELELEVAEKLDLVLQILVKSRLVFQIPALPSDRYQLVHDYLVLFVRQKQSAQLIAEIEKEREQRKLTEAKLNQALTQQLKAARRAAFTLTGFVALISGVALIATLVGINSYISNLRLSSSQNKELDRVVSALRAGRRLRQLPGTIPEVGLATLSEMSQAISGAQMVNRMEGHTDEITDIAISADSRLIASASKDKTIRIWRADGTFVQKLKGHSAAVNSVSFSPDGTQIASGSDDGTINLWKLKDKTWTLVRTLTGHTEEVTSVSFSPDGTQIASGSNDKTIRIWHLDDGSQAILRGSETGISQVRFSPDGKKLVSFGEYDAVRIWTLENNQQVRNLESYNTIDVRFSDNSQIVTIISKDGAVKNYAANGELIGSNQLIFAGLSNVHVAFQPNRQLIASVDKRSDTSVKLNRLNEYNNVELEHDDKVTCLSFSSDGKLLVSASKDNRLTIWNLDNSALSSAIPNLDENKNRVLRIRLSPDKKIMILGRANDTLSLLRQEEPSQITAPGSNSVFNFSPNSQTIITASADNVVWLRNAEGQEIQLRATNTRITSTTLSADGLLVVTGNENGSIQLWKADGTLLRTLTGHTDQVKSVIISPDGEIIAAIIANHTIQLWQRDGTLLQTLSGYTEEIDTVIFSPNSQVLVSIGDNGLAKLWRRDGTFIRTLLGPVSKIVFSPDGQIIASLVRIRAATTINLWQVDGTPLQPIEESGISDIEFSPNGEAIAANYGYYRYLIKLWSLDGAQITTFNSHTGLIRDTSFSPDGKTVATASDDNTVRLWNLNDATSIVLRGHLSEVSGVSFSPDGKTIVSVDSSNIVKLWNRDGKDLKTLTDGEQFAADSNQYADISNQISFSPNGEQITLISTVCKQDNSGKCNYSVLIWDKTGKELYHHEGYETSDPFPSWGYRSENISRNISVSSDNRVIALMSRDPTLQLRSLDGKVLKTFIGHENWINSVSFSPDGQTIASASDDHTIRLWNVAGQEIKKFDQGDRVNSVSFSPDGQTIASGSDDKTIKLWNLQGDLLQTFEGHTDRITSVLFKPDGKTLASASDDKTIRLWQVSDGKEVNRFEIPSDMSINNLDSLGFSADGNLLSLGTDQVYLRLLNGIWIKQATFQAVNDFPQDGFPANKDMITVRGNSGVLVLTLGLDDLMARGCDWAGDYLRSSTHLDKGDDRLCKNTP